MSGVSCSGPADEARIFNLIRSLGGPTRAPGRLSLGARQQGEDFLGAFRFITNNLSGSQEDVDYKPPTCACTLYMHTRACVGLGIEDDTFKGIKLMT